MTWSDGLTRGTPAYEIASSQNADIRVVAGPGTGKSFAMKRRVARLLEMDIEPSQILPVTFTRVAAEDLHRELVGLGVDGCEQLEGTTLHSLAMRILGRNHVLEAIGRVARPLNVFELQPLEADLAIRHGGKRSFRRKLKAFEAAWARLQTDEPGWTQNADDQQCEDDLLAWLRFHEAMMIGEVVPELYRYLRTNPAADERSEFTEILVDEYQDLNKCEQRVVDLLSDNANVCIVGDDDQSIYSFKYAHPDGIREWALDHVGLDDITLLECRRCPTTVVDMANALIGRNVQRPVPRALLPSDRNGAGDVRILQYTNIANEVSGVAALIEELIEEDGYSAGDILVLAQRGAIGTPIYDVLSGRNVPVKSYYAESELDAPDAQKRFALLKLFVDREDRVSLRWLIGYGGNNWRESGYRRLRQHCETTADSPWQALERLEQGDLRISHTRSLVERFTEIKRELEELEEVETIEDVLEILFPIGDDAFADLRRLASEAAETAPDDRKSFLQLLSQSIYQPEIPTNVTEVRIMSLHKSKGLSSPITIVAGCVEGLLPQLPDSDLPIFEQTALMEEQRRLFYVAITRVKAEPANNIPGILILSYSQQMPTATALSAGISPASSFRGTSHLHASRFISELGRSAPTPIRIRAN